MLPIKDNDYSKRWPIAEKYGIVARPAFNPPVPLIIQDENRLRDLSFVFFLGWLFTGILNRAKPLARLAIVPCGPAGEGALLVLSRQGTHLASPRSPELLCPEYFTCPLDWAGGAELSEAQKHLCPVVNKLRYNLAHARPDGDVEGLKEPDRTTYCCESRKAKLWRYLEETVLKDPGTYGAMVGGWAFPVAIPFKFFEEYVTGIEVSSNELGKLMEETLLWYAMQASGVLIGRPHAILKTPIEFNEIDLLLYEAAGNTRAMKEEPEGGWVPYLSAHSLCLMEFTIGHHAESVKGDGDELIDSGRSGKDVPKNKLMNFFAFKSFGFKHVHAHYFTITGETYLAAATQQTIRSTEGFDYICMSETCGDPIEDRVLNFFDDPIPIEVLRAWHSQLIDRVQAAAVRFKVALET